MGNKPVIDAAVGDASSAKTFLRQAVYNPNHRTPFFTTLWMRLAYDNSTETYEHCLHLWTDISITDSDNGDAASCGKSRCKKCVALDVPRTIGMSYEGSRYELQQVQLTSILGASLMAPLFVNSDGIRKDTLDYSSGMSFIGNFALEVVRAEAEEGGREDACNAKAFMLLQYIFSRCPWLCKDRSYIERQFSTFIIKMLKIEFPDLFAALGAMVDVEALLMGVFYSYYATLFVMRVVSKPSLFTMWCWDVFIGYDDSRVPGIIIVALLGMSKKKIMSQCKRGAWNSVINRTDGENLTDDNEIILFRWLMRPAFVDEIVESINLKSFNSMFTRLANKYLD